MSPSGSELLWWDSVAAARLFEQFTAHTPPTRLKALRVGDLVVRVKDEYEGWAGLEGAGAASQDLARGHVLLGFYAARAVSNLDPGGSSLMRFLAGFEGVFSTWVGNNWQLWSERPVNILGRGRGHKLGTRWVIEYSEQFMYAWMERAMPECAPQGYGGTLSEQALESCIARTLEMWSREAGHPTGSDEVRALLARGCAVFRAASELASGADLQGLFSATVEDLIERIERAEPIGAIGRPVDPASGYVPFLPAAGMAEVADQRSRASAAKPLAAKPTAEPRATGASRGPQSRSEAASEGNTETRGGRTTMTPEKAIRAFANGFVDVVLASPCAACHRAGIDLGPDCTNEKISLICTHCDWTAAVNTSDLIDGLADLLDSLGLPAPFA